jgi:hypothetical protein
MARIRESFHEVQRFPLARMAVVLAIPPCTMLALLVWQVILGHPFGKIALSNMSVIGWTIFLWILYFRLITVRLVTDVRDRELIIAMRGLWWARRILAADVSSVETIVYDPQLDYGGYGIRKNRDGKAFIATGDRGVRIQLTDGSKLVVGSQRPNELGAVLEGIVAQMRYKHEGR